MVQSSSSARSFWSELPAERESEPSAGVPGKRTLTAQLPAPRQAKAAGGGAGTGAPASAAGSSGVASGAADPFALHLGPAGAGDKLPDELRAKMERAFSADFSGVRVHQGGHVAALGALAYAQGEELHFAPGHYDPHSQRGQELIGHELAHVMQQRAGRVAAADAQGKGSGAMTVDAGLEDEADALGARAARGELVGGAVSSGGSATAAVRQAKSSSSGLLPALDGGGRGHQDDGEDGGGGEDEREREDDVLEPERQQDGQLVTANQRLLQEAFALMPPRVQRFVLSLQLDGQQRALVLQLRTRVLAHILSGLIQLPMAMQLQLPSLGPHGVRELFVGLARQPSSILALPPPSKPSAGPRQLVNEKSGEWEYFFSYEQSEFPDIDPSDGSYRNDGYRYELLRYEEKGAYFRRARQGGGGGRGRDFRKEKLLTHFFELLVEVMGQALPAGKGDFAAVAQLIQYGQLAGEPLATTADRILGFFQGMFLDAHAKAREQEPRRALELGWARFCSFLSEQLPQLGGCHFQPVPSLDKASPELVEEHRRRRAGTVAPSFGVEVEGEEGSVLVHRSDADIEILDGVAYVRVYQTVYAPCFNGSFKDIKQLESGKVIIEAVGGKSWMNMGWPLRAFHYVKTYAAQGVTKGKEARDKLERERQTKYKGKDQDFQVELQKVDLNHGLPIVRTFLVPKDFHDEYTEGSISENQVDKLGSNHTLNVDKSKAPNQYGVRARDVRLFQQKALPFSLVSFVKDGEQDRYKDPQHGTVMPLSHLAKFLRMPSDGNPFVPPMKGTHVESAEVQKQHAETLGQLFDLTCQIEKLQGYEEDGGGGLQQLIDLWDALALPYGVSFPVKPGLLGALKDAIERAATFALVPSLIDQNYEDMCLRMRNLGNRESGEAIDPFVELQNVKLIEHPSVKDDEVAPSQVKREHAEGRVGESCNAMIEILILCFQDGDAYFLKADLIRSTVEHMLFVMTREKLCGEDPTRVEVVELLKTVLVDRVVQGVRGVVGERPKQRKRGATEEVARAQLVFDGRKDVIALCLGHFLGLVHSARVPQDLGDREQVARQLVMARAAEVAQELQAAVLLAASLLGAKGGASQELTEAFLVIQLFLAQEPVLPSLAAAEEHLSKLVVLLRTCQALPKGFHSTNDREVRAWMKRMAGDVARALLPPKEKGKGSLASAPPTSGKKGHGGTSAPKLEQKPLELTLQGGGHADLLGGERDRVIRAFSEELARFAMDVGALASSYLASVQQRTGTASGLVAGYRRWLSAREPSSALQEQFLRWFLSEISSMYLQFKKLEKARGGGGGTKPFESELDQTPPDYSPFTGVYDRSLRALRQGGGGGSSSSSDHEDDERDEDHDKRGGLGGFGGSGGFGTFGSFGDSFGGSFGDSSKKGAQGGGTEQSSLALGPGKKVRFEYLIGEAHVLGTIVSGPDSQGCYRVVMTGAVRPGGLVHYTRPKLPHEASSLDYMNGTLFGAIPGASFLNYEDGSPL